MSTTANRLADLTIFVVGYGKFLELQGDPTVDAKLWERHVTKVEPLLKRYLPSLNEGMIQFYEEPATELRRKTAFRLATRNDNVGSLPKKVEFLSSFMSRLGARQNITREIFQGKALKGIRTVASAVDEAPGIALNRLASVSPASGLKITQRWLEKAADIANHPISEIESIANDLTSAKELGQEIKDNEARIQSLDPGDPEVAELRGKKKELLDRAKAVADSSKNPEAVTTAVAEKIAEINFDNYGYQTDTGKRLGLTPEQEVGLMARGRSILAAGAGSGKTRVLAGKVAYHINELGVPAESIMATSFTRKSAAELMARVEKFGAVIDGPAKNNFGTTHSIAGKMLNTRAKREFKRPAYFGKREMWKQNILIRLAMEQVKMGPTGIQPPEPRGLWEDLMDDLAVQNMEKTLFPDGPEEQVPAGNDRHHMEVRNLINFFENAQRNWGQKWQGWIGHSLRFLNSIEGVEPQDMSKRDKDKLNKLLSKQKNDRATDYRVAAKKKKDPLKGLTKYTYAQTPANQWFNIGAKLTQKMGQGEMPIPSGDFKRNISIWKGKGLSPSEVWANEGSDAAAVYAAYEWLKGVDGEPEFQQTGDMDDLLIDAVGAMVGDPLLLRQLNNQFKVMLIDEAQDLNRCVSGDTILKTPEGEVSVKDLEEGQLIQSYRNGRVVYRPVISKVPSSWKRGVRIHTRSGKSLLMSPDHQIYATTLGQVEDDNQLALYLMYREGMGFRIGTSRRPFHATENGSSGRASTERANALWVLEIGPKEDILYKEQAFSLEYAVPTYLFEGGVRGCNQPRIQRIFDQFGENGRVLLDLYDLSFAFPHWTNTGYTHNGYERRVFSLYAHRGHGGSQRGTAGSCTWTNGDGPESLSTYSIKGGRKMAALFSANYSEARALGIQSAREMGARFVEFLSFGNESLRLQTASQLFSGQRVLVNDGDIDLEYSDLLTMDQYRDLAKEAGVDITSFGAKKKDVHRYLRSVGCDLPLQIGSNSYLDEIEWVEEVCDEEFWDLAVGETENFFGNGILSHNCQHLIFGLIAGYLDPETLLPKPDKSMTADTFQFIGDDRQAIYAFRGADPEEFINKSDLTDGGDNFETDQLTINFRSGSDIVEAANRLIAYNEKQIPIACKAYGRKGDGQIVAREAPDTESAALSVVEDIKERIENEGISYKDFGIAIRTNAEAYAYGLEMLKQGIPFKSKARFFNDRATKSLIGWLTIAEVGLNGDPNVFNKALLDATSLPTSFLGNKFKDALENQGEGNWYQWLTNGGAEEIYGRRGRTRSVYAFLENVEYVAGLTGPPSSLLDQIMEMVGADGESIVDTMVTKVREDDEKMSELIAESGASSVDEGMIKDLALAPIEPLRSLFSGKEDVSEAMEFVRTLQQVNEKISSNDSDKEIERDAVTISTAHGWKGLECPHMFVPMVGGKFPHPLASIEDERRLAYVAVTRAEESCVVLNIPGEVTEGKQKRIVHSQFVDELCLPSGSSRTASYEEDEEVDLLGLPEGITEDELDDMLELMAGWEELDSMQEG